jgi:lysine 6-dehydrogenase
MDEKTIRWPGHVAQIKTLIECGLLETNPIQLEGQSVVPRRLVSRILSDRISLGREKDISLLRVDVTGRKDGKRAYYRYQMIDHYDPRRKMTSMARTTAFPCSVAAQMLGMGRVDNKGLIPPELAFRGALRKEFLREVSDRGIKISTTCTSGVR